MSSAWLCKQKSLQGLSMEGRLYLDNDEHMQKSGKFSRQGVQTKLFGVILGIKSMSYQMTSGAGNACSLREIR